MWGVNSSLNLDSSSAKNLTLSTLKNYQVVPNIILLSVEKQLQAQLHSMKKANREL